MPPPPRSSSSTGTGSLSRKKEDKKRKVRRRRRRSLAELTAELHSQIVTNHLSLMETCYVQLGLNGDGGGTSGLPGANSTNMNGSYHERDEDEFELDFGAPSSHHPPRGLQLSELNGETDGASVAAAGDAASVAAADGGSKDQELNGETDGASVAAAGDAASVAAADGGSKDQELNGETDGASVAAAGDAASVAAADGGSKDQELNGETDGASVAAAVSSKKVEVLGVPLLPSFARQSPQIRNCRSKQRPLRCVGDLGPSPGEWFSHRAAASSATVAEELEHLRAMHRTQEALHLREHHRRKKAIHVDEMRRLSALSRVVVDEEEDRRLEEEYLAAERVLKLRALELDVLTREQRTSALMMSLASRFVPPSSSNASRNLHPAINHMTERVLQASLGRPTSSTYMHLPRLHPSDHHPAFVTGLTSLSARSLGSPQSLHPV